MSRMSERLARAEERLAAIEARDRMKVIIAGATGRPDLVIDFAAKASNASKASKVAKPKRKANGRRTTPRRSRRDVETAR